jgi:hypothetical protein
MLAAKQTVDKQVRAPLGTESSGSERNEGIGLAQASTPKDKAFGLGEINGINVGPTLNLISNQLGIHRKSTLVGDTDGHQPQPLVMARGATLACDRMYGFVEPDLRAVLQ